MFDERRSRVFAVRANAIEDSREFAVDVEHLAASATHLPSRRHDGDARRSRKRVADTVTLLRDLHDRLPFDSLVLVAPHWARALVRRHLPSALALKTSGFVNIPVDAGDSKILEAASGRLISRKVKLHR
jgi:hypothetical protein